MKLKSRYTKYGMLALLLSMCMALPLAAHDEGHKTPDVLPPRGPHGGKYIKLQKHYAEVIVSNGQVRVHILEPDVKFVAEDASDVTLAYSIPGRQKKTELSLSKQGQGYQTTLNIPASARRVIFYVSCKLDGKKESGQMNYEARR